MATSKKPLPKKTPRRPHFIAEWMEAEGLKAIDLSRAIGADKSSVSRWVKDGTCPNEDWQEKLGKFFKCGRDGLFQHPDANWLNKFFEGRQRDEVERIKASLEAGFPKHRGATGE